MSGWKRGGAGQCSHSFRQADVHRLGSRTVPLQVGDDKPLFTPTCIQGNAVPSFGYVGLCKYSPLRTHPSQPTATIFCAPGYCR